MVAWLLEISAFLTVHLGISVPPLGLTKFPFGGCVVTSVGMLGVKDAYVPFPPVTRVPIIVAVCATDKKPIVDGDKVIVAPVIGLNITVDHRFCDGGRAAVIQ